MDRKGQKRKDTDRKKQKQTEMDRNGQKWTVMDRIGEKRETKCACNGKTFFNNIVFFYYKTF